MSRAAPRLPTSHLGEIDMDLDREKLGMCVEGGKKKGSCPC